MTGQPDGAVTLFLKAIGRGDTEARQELWSAVYGELHEIAAALMAREQVGHTLQPTALVHEAYARLVGGAPLRRESRGYFFRAAAQAMRRILIEHARRRKRPHLGVADDLERLVAPTEKPAAEALEALDEALDALAEHDRCVGDVVMLRFFAGLTVEQTADLLSISPRTVKRCWTYGRTWLYRRLAGRDASE